MTKNFGWNFEHSYAKLPGIFYTKQNPTPVPAPRTVLINNTLATALGLDAHALTSEECVAILAGNYVPEGALPLAQAYAGHQFGYFTMLGDGRAVLLGEQIAPSGQRYDLQLKGSGPTPYSRRGDGRAALGPMLREYIISEAMYALGIPTTRSLAVVTTGEWIQREEPLQGAILTRVAASHLRVGTFEFAARMGSEQDLEQLADYAIWRHYPELSQETERYLRFLRSVIRSQASLLAKWMLVGFVHGVMNTDNMALSGETIDYGPCAFMDTFDPATVFSSIDQHSRYAYANQPKIAGWNLARFAETLLPLLDDDQEKAKALAEAELQQFFTLYDEYWLAGMGKKIGLRSVEPEDQDLVRELLTLMYEQKADYTLTFLDLTFERTSQQALADAPTFQMWKTRWQERLERSRQSWEEAQELMKRNNPGVIPRNHKVEEALRAAIQDEDYDPLQRLLKVLEAPFSHSPEQKEYALPPEPSTMPYRTFCGT